MKIEETNWYSVDYNLIQQNNQQEITKFYKIIINWLNFITKKNEELSHDIFLKLLNNLSKYNPKRGKIHNFIYTLVINEYKTQMRPKKRKIKTEYIDNKFDVIEIIDEEIDYEEQLNQLMNDLTFQEQIFILNYIHSDLKKTQQQKQSFMRLKKKLKFHIYGQKT